MTDILAKLCDSRYDGPLNAEAADEIERLRAVVEKAGDHPLVMASSGTNNIDRCHRVINRLEADNIKLRRAANAIERLRTVVKKASYHLSVMPSDRLEADNIKLRRAAVEEAREPDND